MTSASDPAEVAFEQCDAGAFERDVGAGAHGDANVGLGEGGSVVHAVTGHGDDAAFGLEFFYDCRFLIGQNFSLKIVDSKFARESLRGGAAVASEHHNADVVFAERGDRGDCGFLYGIGNGDKAKREAAERHENYSLSVGF